MNDPELVEFVNKIRSFLQECESTRGQDNKKKVVIDLYSYACTNKSILVSRKKHKTAESLLQKLCEFVEDEEHKMDRDFMWANQLLIFMTTLSDTVPLSDSAIHNRIAHCLSFRKRCRDYPPTLLWYLSAARQLCLVLPIEDLSNQIIAYTVDINSFP